jgi:hypothetical protein
LTGASVEVIDLRTLAGGLGGDRLRCGRQPGARGPRLAPGYGAEIAARIADDAFHWLDAPVPHAATDTFVAYAELEEVILPQVDSLRASMVGACRLISEEGACRLAFAVAMVLGFSPPSRWWVNPIIYDKFQVSLSGWRDPPRRCASTRRRRGHRSGLGGRPGAGSLTIRPRIGFTGARLPA